MARSRNTIGNILQKVGRTLSGGSSTSRKGGRRTKTRSSRRGRSSSGKGLLRRLLS